MKIKIFKNTQITMNQIVNPLNINDYLTNFDFLEFDINGKNISSTSFEDIFELPIESNSNYDFAIVEEFVFLKNITSYFQITKIKYDSENNFLLKFELNCAQTFFRQENFKNEFIVDLSHINVSNEFQNLTNFTLKKDNFFLQEQKIPIESQNLDFKSSSIKTKLNKDNPEVSKKWTIFFLKPEELNLGSTNIPDPEGGIFGNLFLPWLIIVAPNKSEKFSDGIKEIDIYANQIYENLKNSPNLIFTLTIDFCPININFQDGKFNINSDDGIFLVDSTFNALRIGSYIPNFWKIELFNEEPFFNWIKNEIIDYEDAEKIFLKKENEIILNFSPFKKFQIGIFTESNNSGLLFNNNQQLNQIHNSDISFGSLKIPPVFNTSIIFETKDDNLIYGQQFQKISRDFGLPQSIDAWQTQQINKSTMNSQDIILPAAATSIAAASSGSIGALIGLSLSLASVFSRRRATKDLPDTITNAANEIISSFVTKFDTKALTKFIFSERDQNSIAKIFHKFGYSINNFKNITEVLNQKYLFQFLKISKDNDLNILDLKRFSTNEIAISFLQQLKEGIHFWNYDSGFHQNIKDNFWNYDLINPDKSNSKHPLKQTKTH